MEKGPGIALQVRQEKKSTGPRAAALSGCQLVPGAQGGAICVGLSDQLKGQRGCLHGRWVVRRKMGKSQPRIDQWFFSKF